MFGFWNIFKCSIDLHAKSNRCLLKTAAIFLLNFVVKTADWFLLVSFVFSAKHKPFVICTRVKGELLSFLSQSELSNSFAYIVILDNRLMPTSLVFVHVVTSGALLEPETLAS